MSLIRLVLFLLITFTLLYRKAKYFFALPIGQQFSQKYFMYSRNKKNNYCMPITIKIIGRVGICRFSQQQLWLKTCSYG
jgi:hypothetical protein